MSHHPEPAVRRAIRIPAGCLGLALLALAVALVAYGERRLVAIVLPATLGTLFLTVAIFGGRTPLESERPQITGAVRRYRTATLACCALGLGLGLVVQMIERYHVLGFREGPVGSNLLAAGAACWLVGLVLLHFWLFYEAQLKGPGGEA